VHFLLDSKDTSFTLDQEKVHPKLTKELLIFGLLGIKYSTSTNLLPLPSLPTHTPPNILMSVLFVEIKVYSIACFDHISEMLFPWNFHFKVWGSGVVSRCATVHASSMKPTLNGSSAIRCFKCSDVIEI